ncbi:CHAP domain-containing protein [Falsiroseomonas sp. HW251]|uniref:CHAP domain-containing protein n=1 Tax=Falsiroseomonas sp. HW251 TaxID=3390998 RepID=UPI003D31F298
MRAGSALVVFSVLFGSIAVVSTADANTTNRQTQKQGRTAQQQVQPAQQRQAAGATRQAPTPRMAIAPQEQAQSALLTPAVARGQFTSGTPLLPVSMTGGLSCVPYVRMATGMNVSGDARAWWYNAAGVYARGQQPERGAVLAFMGSGGMSRGHVAVVSRVINARTVLIDHANWGGPGLRRGQVIRGATVVDVSDRNDWTQVRVQVGYDNDTFGRTYPTHGFIYNRPEGNRVFTASVQGMQEVAMAGASHGALHMLRVGETLGD